MLYIISTLLSGIFSGTVSILFREYEIKNKTITVGRQFLVQVLFFFLFLSLFYRLFSGYSLNFGTFLNLNWIFIYIIFSSLSYYMVQVLYEWGRGVPLFPTDMEVEEFIEEQMNK